MGRYFPYAINSPSMDDGGKLRALAESWAVEQQASREPDVVFEGEKCPVMGVNLSTPINLESYKFPIIKICVSVRPLSKNEGECNAEYVLEISSTVEESENEEVLPLTQVKVYDNGNDAIDKIEDDFDALDSFPRKTATLSDEAWEAAHSAYSALES